MRSVLERLPVATPPNPDTQLRSGFFEGLRDRGVVRVMPTNLPVNNRRYINCSTSYVFGVHRLTGTSSEELSLLLRGTQPFGDNEGDRRSLGSELNYADKIFVNTYQPLFASVRKHG